MTLAEVASITGGELEGSPEFVVQGLASLDDARADELSFVRNTSYLSKLKSSRAGAVLAPPGVEAPGKEVVRCEDTDVASVTIARAIEASLPRPEGVDERAFVSPKASLGEGVAVGPLAVIQDGATVGARTLIGGGSYVGRGVKVGRDCILHPNCTILRDCVLGDRVVLHSGVVIGADGFGFLKGPDGVYVKRPQLGNVVVGDDVEMGASTCIDRATLGSTVIGSGVKLDNLVNIAHNVRVGEDSVMAAQVGIAGSTEIGRGVQIAGQVGIVDHVRVGDGVLIGAQSGISKDVKSGIQVFGSPAREKKKAFRETVSLRALPALRRRLADLIRRVEALAEKVSLLERGREK